MTLDDLARLIEGTPKRGGFDGRPAIEGRCPACAADGKDRTGNHLLAWSDGEWLHLCHCTGPGNHDEAAVMAALGWTQDDRRIVDGKPLSVAPRSTIPATPRAPRKATPPEERPPMPPEGPTYCYVNPKGAPALSKKRTWEWKEHRPARGPDPERPADWYRAFKQWAPGGGKLDGRGEKLLYGLPAVIAAAEAGGIVFLNEGEKACDRYPEGAVATCQPNGAGSGTDGHWTAHHTAWLRGAGLVVIVADRDAVGKSYARYVGACLEAEGIPHRIVHSRAVGDKFDAWDHFEAGFGLNDFLPMDEPTPDELAAEDGLTMWSEEESDCPPAEWIIEGYLLAGVLTLLDGKKGTTKTTMALQWAAKLSQGIHPFLWSKEGWRNVPLPLPCGPVKTLYIHKGEDPSKKYDMVFRENGGRPGFLAFLDEPLFKLDKAGIERIRALIVKYGFRYVVIDNLIYYLSMLVRDTGDAVQVGPIVLDIQRLASETGAAFHAMRHMKKGSDGKAAESEDISESGLGSVIIPSIARGQHVIRRSKDKHGVYVLTCERGTIDTEPGVPIGWRKFGLELEYLDAVEDPSDKTSPTERMSQRSKARDVLSNLSSRFETLTRDVQRTILDLGVSDKTMRRAFDNMGIVSAKQKGVPDGRFYCRKPDPFEGEDFDPWA